MFERYSLVEYKKLLVCTLTGVEWICPFKFANLPLIVSSYSHFCTIVTWKTPALPPHLDPLHCALSSGFWTWGFGLKKKKKKSGCCYLRRPLSISALILFYCKEVWPWKWFPIWLHKSSYWNRCWFELSMIQGKCLGVEGPRGTRDSPLSS